MQNGLRTLFMKEFCRCTAAFSGTRDAPERRRRTPGESGPGDFLAWQALDCVWRRVHGSILLVSIVIAAGNVLLAFSKDGH